MPPRTKSSQKWLKEHFDDPFVKQSRQDGYRSRAAYKLLEIQKKDNLLRRGMCVIDLGAAPGSFSQIAVECIGETGKIIALDLLHMTPINDVDFIQGDFRDEVMQQKILALLDGRKVDVILSDMAPNMSGSKHIDIPRAMGLVEEVVFFATEVLAPGGSLLIKLFQGTGFDTLLKQVRSGFDKAMIRKPEASRARSSECFLLAKGYKGGIVFS